MSGITCFLKVEMLAASALGTRKYIFGQLPLLLLAVAVVIIALLLITLFVLQKNLKEKDHLIALQREQLQQIADRLNDQALIKEKYIGHFFTLISDYISRIEKLKRGVERKIAFKKYEDIALTLNEINIKKERECLFKTFDSTFLTIFPSFVQDFNAMLKPEDQIWPSKPGTLTRELRIFALMRLGISDCETMSGILEYSANTVYVYKMRIKSRAVHGSNNFEQKLMDIKSVETEGSPALRKSA